MTIEVFTPRWKELLSRLFLGRGGRGGPLEVLDDVMPVVPLIDASEAEMHRARQEEVWAFTVNAPAVVGDFSRIYIDNPTLSQRLVVVEQMFVGNASAAGVFYASVRSGIQGAATSPFSFDTRRAGIAGFPAPTYVATSSAVPSALPTGAYAVVGVAGNLVPLTNPTDAIILAPGSGIDIVFSIANAQFVFRATGYTRAVEPNELA